MAICKQLVELMQGDIGVESEMGQGSTFWVTLPLVVVQWSSHSRQPDATPSHSPQGMTHLPRILLVEDTRINQKVVQHQLSLLGYQADVAQNGQEAVARLTEQVYDLVLMDCQMPILDGFQATQVLREREKGGQRLVIVGLTGQVSERDRAQGLAAGMDDYLTKPLTLESLQETLDKWLGRRQEAGGGRQKQ